MDQKQHTFPRFLLDGFALNRVVHMYDRDARFRVPISIDRATAIGSFYSLPEDVSISTVELESSLAALTDVPKVRDSIIELRGDRAYLKPGAMEVLLGHFEAQAAGCIPRLISEGPPTINGDRASERFNMASFIGLQMVRGQSFRRQMDQIMREVARAHITSSPEEVTQRWREVEEPGSRRIDDPIQHLLDSLDGMKLAKINKLGEMLPMAFDELSPRLFAMNWRVLRYDEPNVITSDEGTGLWTRPSSAATQTPGIVTSDAIYFPIDARHILQMTHSKVTEILMDGDLAKLRHSNNSVASSAHRWIIVHPENTSVSDLILRPRARVAHERINIPAGSDGAQRTLIRYFESYLE